MSTYYVNLHQVRKERNHTTNTETSVRIFVQKRNIYENLAIFEGHILSINKQIFKRMSFNQITIQNTDVPISNSTTDRDI